MSETENVVPRDVQGQLNKVKDMSKMNVDMKTMRTPFKDIGNKSSSQNKSPLKGKLATPSKFEAIQSLDDDENWRDRTEVVTKLEHTTYKIIAREIVEEVIEKLPGMSESPQTVPELKVAKMTFREQPSSNMDDSVFGLDDTISLPQLDETISLPRVESRLNIPVANSTLLNTTSTSPGAPDQSDTVFENSLLSSFEKMQIKGVKGAVVDEDDDDIFHDASDDIDSFSASPVRDQNISAKQPVEQLNDPLDMLMSCMEKITVHDEDQRNLAGKDDCVDSVERAQLLFNNTKGMPCNFEVLQVGESDVKSRPVVGAENAVNREKINFNDPDFNPFLTGTSMGHPAESEKSPNVSLLGVKPKVDEKNLPRKSELEATENNVIEGNQELRETANEINSNHFDTPLSQSISPKTETLSVKGNTSAVNLTSEHKPESEEFQHSSYNLETAQDHKFECSFSQNIDINVPSHVVQEDKDASQVMMPKPDSEEAAIVPPKVSYDLDRILKCCDDPMFDPFASKSFVVNSPDLQADLQDKNLTENSNNFDYSVNGLQPITGNIPSEKKYSLEVALDCMKDPDFDPFLSKSLIINSPDLIDSDDAPKVHNGNSLTKNELECDSKASVCKTDNLEEKNMPDDLVSTEASTESSCFIADTTSLSDEFSMRNFDKSAKPVSQDNPEVVSPKRKYDEAFVGEMEDCDEELLGTKEDTGPSEEVNNGNMDAKTSGQETEEPVSKILQVEEITPPKKGYNLDSIDNIDDRDFNPFATKTSVVNTPSKNSEFLSGDTSKKGDPDSTDKLEQKATSSCKKGVSESNISKSEISNDTKQASEANFNSLTCKPFNNENIANPSDSNKDQDKELDTIPIPKKVYQLDFLDNLDDPSFNPFATKSSVMNSPGNGSFSLKSVVEVNEGKKLKGEATATAEEKQCTQATKKTESSRIFEEKKSTQISEEKIPLQISEVCEASQTSEDKTSSQTSEDKTSSQTTQAGEKSGVSKPKVIKKAMKPTLKKKAPVVKSKVEESEMNSNEREEEISLPKKSYQLDILDNLDDPSFNPFTSKSSVANSPAKITAQGQEAVDSEVSCKHETKNKVENLQEPSSSVQQSKQSKVDMKDVDISVPGKDCKFDSITDPSHSRVSSDASAADTSKKVSFAASDRETALICPKESKEGDRVKDEEMSNDVTVKSTVIEPAELEPPENRSCQLSSKPVSSVSDSMFESIAKEAMRLVAEVTPKKQLKDKKIVQASVQARQRDVFSPQLAQSGVSGDPGVYNFEEFINATDFSDEKQEPIEEELFNSAFADPLFSNPGDLDELSEHGKDGDKLNLVRNSLYMKFDPLVSGRQSLAPYLVQQKLMQKEEPDPRRSSALMCFSPSPDKTQRGGEAKGTGTPVRPLLKTRADETLVMDATANMTLNDATVCEGHNSTVVAASSSTAFNTTIISQGGNFHDDTIFQEPAVPEEKMIPEREMLKKIKDIEQTAHLVMQDKLLRQSRVLEEVNRKMKKQMEESEIALAELEQENSHLRSAIQHLQSMLKNVVEQGEKKIKEAEREHLLMENKYDLECKALKEEVQQHQEELKKVESQFSDLIKKYMRTQELTETMRKNEEVLKTEKEALRAELTKKKESFAIILKTLEEKFNEAQQEFLKEREKHEHENAKLIVLGKKAEVKILSLTETVEKKTKEIQRLTALIDDITSKFG